MWDRPGPGSSLQRPYNAHTHCWPAVAQGLKQHGASQPLQALMRIPRNLRTMYLHAYQSCLWNAAASHRVSTFPHDRPVAGDLVMLPPPQAAAGAGVAGAAVNGAAQDPPAETAAAEDGGAEGDWEAASSGAAERHKGSVHVVTESEAASGVYSMRDVVLPLPGWQIEYPQHASAQVRPGACAALGGWCDVCKGMWCWGKA